MTSSFTSGHNHNSVVVKTTVGQDLKVISYSPIDRTFVILQMEGYGILNTKQFTRLTGLTHQQVAKISQILR